MGVKPEEVLHVGDSLSGDVAGANRLGINTCWLNRNRKSNHSDIKADIECYKLIDLLQYVEKY